MTTDDALTLGRESFARRRWGDAFAQLSAADAERALEPADLELLAMAAFFTGNDDRGVEVLTHLHRTHLDRDNPEQAAMSAFHIGMNLMNRGDMAQAAGWFARGRRALDDGTRDCLALGYLLVPMALQSMFAGDIKTGLETFERVAEFASRFADPDLTALGCLGRGQTMIALGRAAEGVALLDEAMVAVLAGEVGPLLTGIVYCASIEACHEIFDLRRAHEWTAALTRWCDSQQDLVPFRGPCLVHRAELMQLHGAWTDALDEATRAQKRLSDPPNPAVGNAYYQLAEIHRLRGSFSDAEEAYRRANQQGRTPQPGLALLRLAQGQRDAAAAAIRRELDEKREPVPRARLLPAHVEIMLAANDLTAARSSADELASIAAEVGAPLLTAVAAHADGAVRLDEGDPRAAMSALRAACTAWQQIEAPYEAARVRVLIGKACRALGDTDTADLELDAAREVFSRLGAVVALGDLDALSQKAPKAPGGLTAREVEVLRLVAAGKTNRMIAAALVLSEKTVARHLSNIFTKLGVGTRAAATAYAYEHDLVS